MHSIKYIFLLYTIFLTKPLYSIKFQLRGYVEGLDGFNIPEEKQLGIFGNFIQELLTVLSTEFPGKKLKKVAKWASKSVEKMNYDQTDKLAKVLTKMSKMEKDEIEDEVLDYFNKFNSKPPKLVEFIMAMDKVFTAQQAVLFDDYVYDMRNYGIGDKLDMAEETENILGYVILSTVLQRPKSELSELKKKLKEASKEFRYGDY